MYDMLYKLIQYLEIDKNKLHFNFLNIKYVYPYYNTNLLQKKIYNISSLYTLNMYILKYVSAIY